MTALAVVAILCFCVIKSDSGRIYEFLERHPRIYRGITFLLALVDAERPIVNGVGAARSERQIRESASEQD
jgi:hypothetical protein